MKRVDRKPPQSKPSESSSEGGCFITTATLSSIKSLDDNCLELQTFRHFRDTWLKTHHPQDIEEYYTIAPSIVTGINACQNSGAIYQIIWNKWLLPCMQLIRQGSNESAYLAYKKMVEELTKYSK